MVLVRPAVFKTVRLACKAMRRFDSPCPFHIDKPYSMKQHITIGVAGHVDHGKTALVKNITGIDTDRHPEEKQRGLSLEAGIACWPRPDGTVAAFVDVPGHRDFLKNTVRGLQGVDFAVLEHQILPSLAMLNGPAMAAALAYDLHAATDITGFGILGHALEMAKGSGVRIMLEYGKLPFYPDSEAMYAKGESTGSNKANRLMTMSCLDQRCKLSRAREELLFDPQTSGGVLLSIPDAQVEHLLAALRDVGVRSAVRIGAVDAGTPGIVVV